MALAVVPGAARSMVADLAPDGSGAGPLALTERQQELERLWAYYRRQEYDHRRVDANGHMLPDTVLEEYAIARQGFLPPGYEKVNADYPLRLRRPTAPLGLVRTIVARFSGLLFSSRRNPHILVLGDRDTEDYLGALAKVGGLWAAMHKARNYGGAMGSVAIGFKFVQGEIRFEAHDPRWCTPTFRDADRHDLDSLEKKYVYPAEVRTRDGRRESQMFWYRRVIDGTRDVVWTGLPVEGNTEPPWDAIEPTETVEHNFGEVPVEWVQNIPVDEDIDGDPDCHGCYEMAEAVDTLLSQGLKGLFANVDPTPVICDDGDLPSDPRGGRGILQLSKDGKASLLEMNGRSAQANIEACEMLEDRVYRLAQCVPESTMQHEVQKTAAEIEKAYSAMFERSDVLREQYGERGVVRLLGKVDRAVRRMAEPVERTEEDGSVVRVRRVVKLPQRAVQDADGRVELVDRTLGHGGFIGLRWPEYVRPTLADVELASRAAAQSVGARLLNLESAQDYTADMFGVDNLLENRRKIRAEHEAAQQAEVDALAAGLGTDPASTPQISTADMMAGAVTLNEFRASRGLPPLLEDGDLTLPQYRVKYTEMFVNATAVASPETAMAYLQAQGGVAPGAERDDEVKREGTKEGLDRVHHGARKAVEVAADTDMTPSKSVSEGRRPA